MTVYHGSTCVIQTPNVMLAKPRLDFGRAFYLTTYRKQAEKWALRKAMRTRGKPIVNVYTLSDDFTGLRVKDFDETDAEWLDFVCACRAGRALWRKFDVIKGRVANDDVFKTVDAYLKGAMSRETAIAELRYSKPNDQIALTNAKSIAALLTFKRYYEMEV